MRQSCSLRKAKAEPPQETPAAEASNVTTSDNFFVWVKRMPSKSDCEHLWVDFGLVGVLTGTTRTTTLFQFRSWLKILAVVSRRQLKPLPLQQRPWCEVRGHWPTLKDLCQKELSQVVLILLFECHEFLVDVGAVQCFWWNSVFENRFMRLSAKLHRLILCSLFLNV